MSKIIYQQSFADPSWKPIGCKSVRVIVFSDGLIQFCDADDDDLLCSCTINDISELAEAYTGKLIDAPAKNNKALQQIGKMVANQEDMPPEFNQVVDKMLDDEIANG